MRGLEESIADSPKGSWLRQLAAYKTTPYYINTALHSQCSYSVAGAAAESMVNMVVVVMNRNTVRILIVEES